MRARSREQADGFGCPEEAPSFFDERMLEENNETPVFFVVYILREYPTWIAE